MTMLADQVDVVIGVDTHKHTNTAAVVRASTGAVLDEATVPTTSAGHEELLALACSHGPLRANDEWVYGAPWHPCA